MNNRPHSRKVIFGVIFSIFFFFACSVSETLRLKQHEAIADAASRYIYGISAAVSTLVYGKKIDFTSYKDISEIFSLKMFGDNPGEPAKSERMKNPLIINEAIASTLTLPSINKKRTQILDREDKGQIYFFILAFKIFGFNVQALAFFYYMLLFFSLVLFIFAFKDDLSLLMVALSFIYLHFIMMEVIWNIGVQLLTPVNPRFFAVLGIIPALHIVFCFLKPTTGWRTVVPFLVQFFILFSVIITRGTANFLVVALIASLFTSWLLKNYPSFRLKKLSFEGISLKSVGVFFTLLLIFTLAYSKKLSERYSRSDSRHLFWHPVYLGLHFHPSSLKQNGVGCCEDSTTYAMYSKHLEELKLRGISKNFSNKEFEAFLRDRTIEFVLQKPWYTVKNYVYKFYQILILPFGPDYPLLTSMLKWQTLIFLLVWIWSFRWMIDVNKGLFIVLPYLAIFSSLPLFIYVPQSYVASDFTVCFFLLLSFLPCYLKVLCSYFREKEIRGLGRFIGFLKN